MNEWIPNSLGLNVTGLNRDENCNKCITTKPFSDGCAHLLYRVYEESSHPFFAKSKTVPVKIRRYWILHDCQGQLDLRRTVCNEKISRASSAKNLNPSKNRFASSNTSIGPLKCCIPNLGLNFKGICRAASTSEGFCGCNPRDQRERRLACQQQCSKPVFKYRDRKGNAAYCSS